jgi:DNA-binding transcriptional ArsR family regulator
MNSLAHLICSRVRAEIFRALFGIKNGELHLREIERQTGFAIGTVRQDIGKLLKLGLVTSRRDGNRVYYAANDRHPLYSEIRGLVLKTVGLTDVIAESLKDEDIQCAFIFGSIASGTEGATSDIDLMIIGNVGLRKIAGMLAGIGNRLGREINPHAMNAAEFARRIREKDHFVTSLTATPRLFVKGSEDVLKGLGK